MRAPPTTSSAEIEHLRVLIANERKDRLDTIVGIVEHLGHAVVAKQLEVEEVAAATAELHPDLALVGLGASSEHALQLISRIVQEAACPVIAILEGKDPTFVREAAKRGLFGYIVNGDEEELQAEIDVVLRRYSEFSNLEGAFGRRAITERAKGVLMGRHLIDEREAFELLRSHSRRTGRKLVDVAAGVVDVHRLLPPAPGASGTSGASGPAAEASAGAGATDR
ncbi:MAG TPA: ANTAR domain-containing protein [Gaiellaceae bacterium]|nr:ANTAR domain-containing protein [Gaiellaceae bacterium]